MSETVAAPPEHFNFAQHLIDAQRGARREAGVHRRRRRRRPTASSPSASGAAPPGLRALGLRREERVLLLMHDGNDWPVAFLGALYAGVVPVAVNTLLTADDYAYMLAHSRAQAALVSGALLPTLQAAMERGGHEIQSIVVARAPNELPAGAHGLRCLARPAGAGHRAGTTRSPTTSASGSTRRARPAGRRAPCTRKASLYWTAELYGKPVLGLTEERRHAFPPRSFLRLRPRQRAELPAVGRRDRRADGRAADARCAASSAGPSSKPTVFFGAPTGFAGMLASPNLPRARRWRCACARRPAKRLPKEIGERFTAHFGCHIVDGIGSTEMLHIFLSNRPGDVRYGTTGKPVPGYEVELRDDDGRRHRRDDEVGDLYIKGPTSALMYWCNRDEEPRDLPGRRGRRPATSTCATPTATTRTPAAATTC